MISINEATANKDKDFPKKLNHLKDTYFWYLKEITKAKLLDGLNKHTAF